jgi:hypothetical protein
MPARRPNPSITIGETLSFEPSSRTSPLMSVPRRSKPPSPPPSSSRRDRERHAIVYCSDLGPRESRDCSRM